MGTNEQNCRQKFVRCRRVPPCRAQVKCCFTRGPGKKRRGEKYICIDSANATVEISTVDSQNTRQVEIDDDRCPDLAQKWRKSSTFTQNTADLNRQCRWLVGKPSQTPRSVTRTHSQRTREEKRKDPRPFQRAASCQRRCVAARRQGVDAARRHMSDRRGYEAEAQRGREASRHASEEKTQSQLSSK